MDGVDRLIVLSETFIAFLDRSYTFNLSKIICNIVVFYMRLSLACTHLLFQLEKGYIGHSICHCPLPFCFWPLFEIISWEAGKFQEIGDVCFGSVTSCCAQVLVFVYTAASVTPCRAQVLCLTHIDEHTHKHTMPGAALPINITSFSLRDWIPKHV